MDDQAFDHALISAAFGQIAERGWHRFDIAAAARAGGLRLDRARVRFPCRAAFLLRFGRIADAAALASAGEEGPVRDRLFDMLMRRIDVFQAHRAGVLALLRALPADPPTALMLAATSESSMGWLLAAAGVGSRGPLGRLRRKGLLAVWLWTLRAWRRDDSEDLAATMAALDHALSRAEQAAAWLSRRTPEAPTEPEPDTAEPAPPVP
jgi:ubiquinone biosynthesis protein COQ9